MSGHTFSQIAPEKLVDIVEAQLLTSILEGRIQQGQRIVEAAVARQMGISRAPLREGIRKLESRGLLVNVARKGVFVRSYSEKEIEDIAQLRLCIEEFAVDYLARHISRTLVKYLVALESEYAASFAGRNARRIIDANLKFHLGLVDLVGNQRISRAFEHLGHEMRLIHSLTGAAADWDFLNPSTYSVLIKAIKKGDVASSRTEIGRLIAGFRRKSLEKFADGQGGLGTAASASTHRSRTESGARRRAAN